MKRTMILVIGIVAALSLVPAAAAGAKGGWATSTLDPLPPMEPGETVDIGFTVRQHGVTPVDLSEFGAGDVGIAFRSNGGVVQFFAAEGQGPIGHHVARLEVPDAGSYEWEVRQGMFAPQPLGTLELGVSDPAAVSTAADVGGDRSWLDVVKWVSIGSTVGLTLIVAVDVLRNRRRRTVAKAS